MVPPARFELAYTRFQRVTLTNSDTVAWRKVKDLNLWDPFRPGRLARVCIKPDSANLPSVSNVHYPTDTNPTGKHAARLVVVCTVALWRKQHGFEPAQPFTAFTVFKTANHAKWVLPYSTQGWVVKQPLRAISH